MRLLAWCLLSAIGLTGCAGWPLSPACPPVLPPQPVNAWGEQLTQAEVITWSGLGGDQRQVLIVAQQSPDALQMRGFNLLGLELFRLTYTHGEPAVTWLTAEPPAFDARVLVADFQLVHWPADRLSMRLSAPRWRLDSDDASRQLYCRNERIADVQYTGEGRVRLFNHRLGYTLEIHPVSAATDSTFGAH